MKKAIWEEEKINTRATKKNIETDILIIGGGITGISTLLELFDKGFNITLIDSNLIGGITSRHTTGKLNVLQGYNYSKIASITNQSTSLKYLESQKEAINIIKNNIKKYKIKCDFKKNDSYLFTNEQENIKRIIEEKNILEAGNIKCDVINNLPNNYPCLYGIKTSFSYTFNPLKYIKSVLEICKKNTNIYGYTRAISICKKLDYFLVKTNRNKIKAKKIIICTHYPILCEKLEFPFKLKISKEYVLAAKTDEHYKANMLCDDGNITSIRYYNNYIIFGGNNKNLCDKTSHKQNMNELITNFRKHFNLEIEYTWYNYDLTSNDYLPIIGKLDNENIIVATAFNKWGMTNGILSAKIINDIILNNDNKYIELFNPNRHTNLKKIMNGCSCCYNNIKGYLTGFKKQKNIKYVNYNGCEYAIYTDKNNIEHKVINKCPHLGCKLLFNELDETWDCPCHGSRFNINGDVIKGPSHYSIKPKK